MDSFSILNRKQRQWLNAYCQKHFISLNIKKLEGVLFVLKSGCQWRLLPSTTANVHDSKAAYPLIAQLAAHYESITSIKADNGYKGRLPESIQDILSIDMQCVKSNYGTSEFIPMEGDGSWSGQLHGLIISDVCVETTSNYCQQRHL